MKIITALFGRKAPISHTPGRSTSVNTYIEMQLKSLSTCISTEELAAFAGDYSGYVRQATLKRCVELARSDLLPIVVERLNDWVQEVRHSARSALITLLPVTNTPQLLATLPSILRLRYVGRADHSEWVALYEKNLIQYATVQELTEGALGSDVHIARACFDLLKKYQLIDSTALLHLSLTHRNDIVVALMAVNLGTELPPVEQNRFFLVAMRSHFGAVRTVALRSLLALEIEVPKQAIAVSALMDAQSSVRAVAMRFLKESGFDIPTYYRESLSNSHCSVQHIRVGLISLAVVGDVHEIDFIHTFIKAEYPAIRLAAFFSWAKLAVNAKDVVAIEALKDISPRIRKFALHMIRREGAYIPFKLIQSTLNKREDVRLLLLFSESNKWDWLESIIKVAADCDQDARIKTYLAVQLKAWCYRANRSYELPNFEQKEFLISETTMSVLIHLSNGEHQLIDRMQFELQQIRVATSLRN